MFRTVMIAFIIGGCSGQGQLRSSPLHPEPRSTGEDDGPPTPLLDASFESFDADLELCGLANGSVEVGLPLPEGFLFQCDPPEGTARVFSGALNPMRAELLLQALVVDVDDAGAESLDGADDAALRWSLAVGLMGPSPRLVEASPITVAGHETTVYRLVGHPPGLSSPRESLVLHLRRSSFAIAVVALFSPDDDSLRREALSLLRAMTIRYP